jgi:hypothetical protein
MTFLVVLVTASPSSPPEAGNATENWHSGTAQEQPDGRVVTAALKIAAFLAMGPFRWQRIERLYHAALERPAGERPDGRKLVSTLTATRQRSSG